MGNLIWRGWVTSWEQIRKAPQPNSILLGRNVTVNTRGPSKNENSNDNPDPLVDDNVGISQVLPNGVEDDGNTMRSCEISFPISPGSGLTRGKSKPGNNTKS